MQIETRFYTFAYEGDINRVYRVIYQPAYSEDQRCIFFDSLADARTFASNMQRIYGEAAMQQWINNGPDGKRVWSHLSID